MDPQRARRHHLHLQLRQALPRTIDFLVPASRMLEQYRRSILLVIRYSATLGTRSLANNSTRNVPIFEIFSEIESQN